MKHSEYRELISLADALIFVSESELLTSKLHEAGYQPASFDLDILLRVVADAIHANLIE